MKLGKLGATIAAVTVLVGGGLLVKSATWIPDGYTGVEVSVRNGAEEETLGRGLNFISPTSRVKKFTTSNEQLLLTKDDRKESKGDESIRVSTSDDANIKISFQMSYHYDPDRVVDTYRKFRGMDGEMIVEERVKNVLKSKVSEVTTNYSIMDIYSGNRSEINTSITKYLDKEFLTLYGIKVDEASIIDVHLEPKLKEAVDLRLATLQQKQQKETEQEKIKVEKATEQLQAEADAKIALTKAQAEADQVKIKAQAQAEANKKIAESLTPELIEKIKYEKWNGSLPQIQGSDSMMIDARGALNNK